MEKRLLFFILAVGPWLASAQNEEVLHVKQSLFKVNFLVPGVEYEGAIGTLSTINLSADLGLQIAVIDFGNSTETEVFFRPIIGGQFRHYYNFDRRDQAGRNVKNNSGNFVGVTVTYMFEPINQPDNPFIQAGSVLAIGPIWGINRTYESGFSLSLYLGGGFVQENYSEDVLDVSGFGFLSGLKLGFATNRDK